MDAGANKSYYLFNAQGDVVQLTDAADGVTQTYDYDAFGNQKTDTPADTNPFRYCGEYFDAETGTIYLRARYYDPSVGRFTRQDPAKDGLNWYAYATNNPIRFIDPFGLYNREAASQYAVTYAYDYNPNYLGFDTPRGWLEYFSMYFVRLGADCTNFTSQALYAGEIEMNDAWHYYKTDNEYYMSGGPLYGGLYKMPDGKITHRVYEYDFTSAWSMANSQYEYFKNPDNGYINGEVIKISSMNEMYEAVVYGGIQIGDLMYFGDDERVHHATMITGFENGGILYSGHTRSRQSHPLSFSDESVYIIRIRDDA